jgi:molecular chaperone GrpE
MLISEMTKAFKAEGIERIDALNKPYDPATQEVVAMIPADEKQDGLVLQEVQMGFMLDGKVLRPARVIVGQHTEE